MQGPRDSTFPLISFLSGTSLMSISYCDHAPQTEVQIMNINNLKETFCNSTFRKLTFYSIPYKNEDSELLSHFFIDH